MTAEHGQRNTDSLLISSSRLTKSNSLRKVIKLDTMNK
jgi:hypothetical protein